MSEIVSVNSSFQSTKTVQLAKAKMVNEELIFQSQEEFFQTLQKGFFLLEIPKKIDLIPGIKLCHNFYKEKDNGNDDQYKGYKKIPNIYFDREHFQTEHVLADATARAEYFPEAVQTVANEMNQIAILVLENVLKKISIPEIDWQQITGGCLENQGTHWFACSHYRPEIEKQGCATHQDTGFVTVLYIDQPGLEAQIDGEWKYIHPEPGYFVINFGRSFEILTEHLPNPVRSVLHRVEQTKKSTSSDRISMAAFTNMPTELNLYQYDKSGMSHVYQSAQEFLEEFNKRTWADKHTDFGINTTQ